MRSIFFGVRFMLLADLLSFVYSYSYDYYTRTSNIVGCLVLAAVYFEVLFGRRSTESSFGRVGTYVYGPPTGVVTQEEKSTRELFILHFSNCSACLDMILSPDMVHPSSLTLVDSIEF